MQRLQARLAKTNVLLVSISVDPENDTPAVLRAYAQQFGASPDRWWFLTGRKSAIHDLVQQRFKLSLVEAPADRAAGAEAISHSDRLALVDRGRIFGFFESSNPDALDALVARASRQALPSWVRTLPAVNASLNALCGALLLIGWFLIRRRPVAVDKEFVPMPSPRALGKLAELPTVRAHATCMVLAVTTSALFLASYLVYHSHAGSMPFRSGGVPRVIYFTILVSHTTLAIAVVPLVFLTLSRALRQHFADHARIAQLTFPIWLYVSITGVVIYLMLYGYPAPANGSSAPLSASRQAGLSVPTGSSAIGAQHGTHQRLRPLVERALHRSRKIHPITETYPLPG
jgi:protein SCO1/2/putative membrane protein